MESIKKVLMRRDRISAEEADSLIKEAREDLMRRLDDEDYIDDADFMEDWFGLEPDYFLDLL